LNKFTDANAVEAMIAVMSGKFVIPLSDATDIKYLYYYKPERVIVVIRNTGVFVQQFSDTNELHTIDKWLIIND
jgi:hypothetical protein